MGCSLNRTPTMRWWQLQKVVGSAASGSVWPRIIRSGELDARLAVEVIERAYADVTGQA